MEFRKIIFLGIGMCVLTLEAVELDRGGATFDFEKISASRFKADSAASENLITNADFSKPEDSKDPYRWQDNYCYLHSKEIPGNDPRRAEARKIVRWEIADGVARVVKPDELKKLLPGKVVASTSGGWRKAVKLPDSNGGNYKLSFLYRSRNSGGGGNCTIIVSRDMEPRFWYRAKQLGFKVQSFPASPEQWRLFTQEIVVPPGSHSLELVFRIDGLGELELKQPMLVKEQVKEPLTLRLSPHGFLDHTFALSQNQPSTMAFVWKRNGSVAESKFNAPVLLLTLPDGVDFRESAELNCLGSKKISGATEYKINLSSRRNRPGAVDGYDHYLRIPALVTTGKAPGSDMRGSAVVLDGDRVVSNVEPILFKVIPTIKAEKPERFLPGIYFGGRYFNFSSPENHAFNASLFKDAGVRWLIGGGGPSQEQLSAWRKAGVDVITPELYFLANGYRVGEPKGRPEADKYKYIGTHNAAEFDRATCPVAVYEKRPFFRNQVMEYIRKNTAGTDGVWANWEPYNYAGRGCFCDVCRKKFAKFAGVSDEEMKKAWPEELAFGKKYYAQAVRFRSLEHAKLVKTVDEAVRSLTGGEKSFGFIPGVQFNTMGTGWREDGFDKETHPSDYASSMRWIDPWGPYPCWNTQNPYVYSKHANLRTFLAAADVRAGVDQDYPPSRRPKLLAFPHGMQCSDWVTSPEAMELDLLSFFFNGFEGATVYAFPKGYDNRYWAAFAQAANVAARYDAFVFNGKKINRRIELLPVQPYALPAGYTSPATGKTIVQPMLQSVAYEWNGRIIVAVFNFWQKGEAFFDLKIAGLNPKEKYTVTAAGKWFTDRESDNFSGSRLASGVRLHAGAQRCVVYEIAPAGNAKFPMEKVVTQGALESFRKVGLNALEAAAKADRIYEELYGAKTSKLTDLSNAGIECRADDAKGTLTFVSGKNQVVLNAATMSVSAWKVNGEAVVNGNSSSGFGTVAFWEPSHQIKGGFWVTSEKKIPDGIEIKGEIRLLDRDNPRLQGMVIRQTCRLTAKCSKIEVTTELFNSSDRTISAGMRYNLIPALPAVGGGYGEIVANGGKTRFKRNFGRALYSTGDKNFEAAVRKLYEVPASEPTRRIDSPEACFSSPALNAELKLTPAKEFLGVAVWDSGRQSAGTFEPCFRLVELAPMDGKMVYSATMSVK